jgi:hypothetical protein
MPDLRTTLWVQASSVPRVREELTKCANPVLPLIHLSPQNNYTKLHTLSRALHNVLPKASEAV